MYFNNIQGVSNLVKGFKMSLILKRGNEFNGTSYTATIETCHFICIFNFSIDYLVYNSSYDPLK